MLIEQVCLVIQLMLDYYIANLLKGAQLKVSNDDVV